MSSEIKESKASMKQKAKEDEERKTIQDLYARNRGIGDGNEELISEQGADLMKQAEKQLKKFFGGSKKYDKAIDLFEQAAAQFKMNDNWAEAAEACYRCAEVYEKQKETLDAANKYADSGLCIARIDPQEGQKRMMMAVQIHTEEGRLAAAARVWKDLAELLEEEDQLDDAIDAWQKAADCHESEGTLANALNCHLHIAELEMKEYRFKRASKHYEKCATLALEKNINKGSLREYFYKALLCQFVVSAKKWNLKNVHVMLDRFTGMDRKFVGTREHSIVTKCVAAFEAEDVAEFTQVIYEHDKIHKLDDQSTHMLLEIKKILKNPPEPENEAEEQDLQ